MMAKQQGQQKTPQKRDDPFQDRGGQGQPRDDELRVEGDPDDDEDVVDAEIELDDEEE